MKQLYRVYNARTNELLDTIHEYNISHASLLFQVQHCLKVGAETLDAIDQQQEPYYTGAIRWLANNQGKYSIGTRILLRAQRTPQILPRAQAELVFQHYYRYPILRNPPLDVERLLIRTSGCGDATPKLYTREDGEATLCDMLR